VSTGMDSFLFVEVRQRDLCCWEKNDRSAGVISQWCMLGITFAMMD